MFDQASASDKKMIDAAQSHLREKRK